MNIKLSDYILENSISSASVDDIMLEQSIAEVEVTSCLLESYFRQYEIALYEEYDTEIEDIEKNVTVEESYSNNEEVIEIEDFFTESKETKTEPEAQETPEEPTEQKGYEIKIKEGHNKVIDQAIEKNQKMSLGSKILKGIGKFIASAVTWFMRAWNRFMGYLAGKKIDKFIKRLENMSNEEKANFKAEFSTSMCRCVTKEDITVKIGGVFDQLIEFMKGTGKFVLENNLNDKLNDPESAEIVRASIGLMGNLKDTIPNDFKLVNVRKPIPIVASGIMSGIFITYSKFMQGQQMFFTNFLKKLGERNKEKIGLTDERMNDLPELTKVVKRYRGLIKIVGTILTSALNKAEKKSGYVDAGKGEYVELNWDQTYMNLKQWRESTDSKIVKLTRKAIDKKVFISNAADAIAADSTAKPVLDLAKVTFSMYKELYAITLNQMSAATRYLGNAIKNIERTISTEAPSSETPNENKKEEVEIAEEYALPEHYTGYQTAAIRIGRELIGDFESSNKFYNEYAIDDGGYSDADQLYTEFLNKHGYDPLSNTIDVYGERVDAGELNVKETRDKYNRLFKECKFNISNDTIMLESDSGVNIVTVSLDTMFPESLMKYDDNEYPVYESYFRLGELIEEQYKPDELFTEGAIGNAIKKGLKAIWQFIKKCFGFIKRQITRFINFIKGLFSKKSTKTNTADKMVSGSGVKLEPSKTETIKKEVITVTGAPGSDIASEKIEIDPRAYDFEIDKSTGEIEFKRTHGLFRDYFEADENNSDELDENGNKIQQHPDAGWTDAETVARIIAGFKINNSGSKTWREVFKDMNDLLDIIRKSIDSGNIETSTIDALSKTHISLQTDRDEPGHDNGYKIKYSQIAEFSSAVNSLMSKFDSIKFDNFEKIQSPDTENVIKDKLNDFGNSLNCLSMGLNKLNNLIRAPWIVNGIYKGSVKTIEDAVKINRSFLDNGLPTKYIRHNLWILLDTKLNAKSPAWGQSRVVFFPEDENVVHKYALNAFGLSSNKTEYEVTQEFKKYKNYENYIAPTFKIYDSGVCIEQERAPYQGDSGDSKKYDKKLNDFITKHPEFKYDIIDQHGFNVARNKNREIVSIDYGFIGSIKNGTKSSSNSSQQTQTSSNSNTPDITDEMRKKAYSILRKYEEMGYVKFGELPSDLRTYARDLKYWVENPSSKWAIDKLLNDEVDEEVKEFYVNMNKWEIKTNTDNKYVDLTPREKQDWDIMNRLRKDSRLKTANGHDKLADDPELSSRLWKYYDYLWNRQDTPRKKIEPFNVDQEMRDYLDNY